MHDNIPIEIWEHAIDYLWAFPAALRACAQVSRAWHPRSLFHLVSTARLTSHAKMYGFLRTLTAHPVLRARVHSVDIWGSSGPDSPDDDSSDARRPPVPHLATFAAAGARRLPAVRTLDIWRADWREPGAGARVLTHLSAFASVAELNLFRVAFPNVPTLGRLVTALPRLSTLFAEDITFRTLVYERAAFHAPPSTLRRVCLDGATVPQIVDFFIDPAEILQSVVIVTVGWYQPLPIAELKCRHIKEMLYACGDALEIFSVWMEAFEVDSSVEFENISTSPPDLSATHHSRNQTDTQPENTIDLSGNASLHTLRIGLRVRTLPPPTADPVTTECTWLHHLLSTATSKQLTLIEFGIHLRGLREEGPVDASRLFALLAAFFSAPMCAEVDALFYESSFSKIETVRARVLCDHDGLMVDEELWGALFAERFPLLDKRGPLR